MASIVEHILHDHPEKLIADPYSSAIPYLEMNLPGKPSAIDRVTSLEPPRLLKTHLQFEFLRSHVQDDKARFIAMFRNPKDTLVSYYHHYRLLRECGNFPGTFHDFFELFKIKHLGFGDIFDWYTGWWKESQRTNVLVLKYEDVKNNQEDAVRKVAQFCGKDLSDDAIRGVVQATTFDSMQKKADSEPPPPIVDSTMGKFFRKGGVGDWKNYFTEDETNFVDKRCEEILDPLGLTFDYE